MKAIIGAKTAIGEFLLTRGKYDYVIDPSNLESIRNKQFLDIICIMPDYPVIEALAKEKDALQFEKLQEVLAETKTERFTLISPSELLQPKNGIVNENSPLYTPETTPSEFIRNRARFEAFVQLRFGRVLTVHLPLMSFEKIDETPERLADSPADMPYQIYSLASLPEDLSKAWKLGISCINMAPEPLTVTEIVREIIPDSISKLKNADAGTVFLPKIQSIHSIHWNDTSGYTCPKDAVIRQIKALLPPKKA